MTISHRIGAVALAGCVAASLGHSVGFAQTTDRFSAHLSVVPVDAAAARRTSGTGTIEAVLIGSDLFLTGAFDGMSAAATAAHLHQAPKGRRGPAVSTLWVSKSAAGVLVGNIKLTGAQLTSLKEGALYIQIHTETNPDGEIRGWLLPVLT